MDRQQIINRVAGVWAEQLAVEEIEADDDFFGLGGDSLIAVTLVTQLETEFAISLDPVVVFEFPYFKDFANAICEAIAGPVSALGHLKTSA